MAVRTSRLKVLFVLFSALLLVVSGVVVATELYRYQDSSGKWHFTDKPPVNKKADAEKIRINAKGKKQEKPSVTRIRRNSRYEWKAVNTLPVSVQFWLRWKGDKRFFHNETVGPFEEKVVWTSDKKGGTFEDYYLIGEPVAKPDNLVILPPYGAGRSYRVSQGFNGKATHNYQGSRYAIDIAMPVGTALHAVRAGVVADAWDNFSVGGTDSYFLNKANHVTVMHEDGTYAVYAHVLHGSLKVNTGDKVKAGDLLARSGNTGFSFGPHLHFVIQYNSGQGVYSVPFRFATPEGNPQEPLRGKRYVGVSASVAE